MRANVEMMDSGYARADVNMALPGQRGLWDFTILRRDREMVQVLLEKGRKHLSEMYLLSRSAGRTCPSHVRGVRSRRRSSQPASERRANRWLPNKYGYHSQSLPRPPVGGNVGYILYLKQMGSYVDPQPQPSRPIRRIEYRLPTSYSNTSNG